MLRGQSAFAVAWCESGLQWARWPPGAADVAETRVLVKGTLPPTVTLSLLRLAPAQALGLGVARWLEPVQAGRTLLPSPSAARCWAAQAKRRWATWGPSDSEAAAAQLRQLGTAT